MADGRTDGIKVVKKANWDGVGIVCPRGRYPDGKKRDEFKSSGVYILIGDNDDAEGEKVYVGETESLSDRLTQHHADREFWRHVIIFTRQSKDSTPLNKANIRYLESRLLKLARDNKRCVVENKNNPDVPQLSEEDISEMNGYLREMLSLLSVINIRAFEEMPESKFVQEKIYSYKGKDEKWKAKGYLTNDNHFIVQKGSTANREEAKKIPPQAKETRRKIKKR